MTASLAAAIRRHIEELEPKPPKVVVHPDDWGAVCWLNAAAEGSPWVLAGMRVPRGCWRIVWGGEEGR